MESAGSLARIIRDGTQDERDHYGHHFLRFMFEAPARTGMLHADPHPGNFRLIPNADGSPGPARAYSTSAPSPGSPSGSCPARSAR